MCHPKEEVNDIYNELSKIQTTSLSQTGKEHTRYFGSRSIKGFLKQRILHKTILKKLNNPIREFESSFTHNTNTNTNSYNHSNSITNTNKHTEDILNNIIYEHYSPCNNKSAYYHSKSNYKCKCNNDYLLHYIKKKNNNKALSTATRPLKTRSKPKTIQTQHKKVHSMCLMYNPNYDSISKHIPHARIKPLNNKTHQYSLQHVEDTSIVHKHNNSVLVFNKVKGMAFDKYSARNDNCLKSFYKDSTLEPHKAVKKVAVPNFKKMMPRECTVNKGNKGLPRLISYSPNYNVIYSNYFGYQKHKDERMRRKKHALKKIWASFDVSKEYVVVPGMNSVSVENTSYGK